MITAVAYAINKQAISKAPKAKIESRERIMHTLHTYALMDEKLKNIILQLAIEWALEA